MIAILDSARRTTFAWALGIEPMRRVLVNKDHRVAIHACVCVLSAMLVAIGLPIVPLIVAPLVLGIPHLASELRWLVIRRGEGGGLPKSLLGLFVTTALFIAIVGGLDLSPRLEVSLAMLTIAIVLGIHWQRSHGPETPRRRLPALSQTGRSVLVVVTMACAVLAIVSSGAAVLIRDLVVALHGFFALGIWVALFRRRRRFALPAIGLSLLGCALVFLARGPIVALAFLQSVHYAVWLVLIPQDGARSEGTSTFRMSVRSWRADLGVPVLVVAMLGMIVLIGSALTFGAERARDTYLSFARFHVWLELAIGAFFATRSR